MGQRSARSTPSKPPKAQHSAPSDRRVPLGVGLLAVAIMAICGLRGSGSDERGAAGALQHHSGQRMGAPVDGDESGEAVCATVRQLWSTLSAPDALGCLGFLAHHWEVAPRLTRGNVDWSSTLMRLSDVRAMVGAFAFRIHKNHGTVVIQKPASGFLADERWQRGDAVPADIVETVLAEQRTLVIHNIEVYWPPVARFTREIVRFFHTYTQVNMYLSPGGLDTATLPHQDAHSVFIVQLHGAKRWSVMPPQATAASPRLTLRAFQRGKHGEILTPDDRDLMGPAVINATLRPGMILYVPRAFFHSTSTSASTLGAPSFDGGDHGGDPGGSDGGSSAGGRDSSVEEGDQPAPSMALTFSVLSEDIFSSWLYLLGEAIDAAQDMPASEPSALGTASERGRVVRSLRARAKGGDSADGGAPLREALPRALIAPCARVRRQVFAGDGDVAAGWRRHALSLVQDAVAAAGGEVPTWAASGAAEDPLFALLDAVLERKRASCHGKLRQLDAFLEAMGDRLPDGQPLPIDIDNIFRIEKQALHQPEGRGGLGRRGGLPACQPVIVCCL